MLALAFAATKLDVLQGTAPSQGKASSAAVAPEFKGITRWLNSEPLTLAGLRGRVTFIDFWTYSCINCVRTLPSNRRIYATYQPFGLQIVGVHSPEFAFEKSESNVRAAIRRLRVPYPVAMDNDMATWRAYRNAYWPRIYLIDARGKIRFDFAGEGHDEAIQDGIRTLLVEAGQRDLPPPIDFSERRFNKAITPEIYGGHERGAPAASLANREGYRPGEVVDYQTPSAATVAGAGTTGSFFLAGKWRNEGEYVEAAEDGARVILPYYAQDVFFVAAARDDGVGVGLLIDGAPIGTAFRSEGPNLRVTRSDLFTAVKADAPSSHVLTLIASKGFRLFSFTFG